MPSIAPHIKIFEAVRALDFFRRWTSFYALGKHWSDLRLSFRYLFTLFISISDAINGLKLPIGSEALATNFYCLKTSLKSAPN